MYHTAWRVGKENGRTAHIIRTCGRKSQLQSDRRSEALMEGIGDGTNLVFNARTSLSHGEQLKMIPIGSAKLEERKMDSSSLIMVHRRNSVLTEYCFDGAY